MKKKVVSLFVVVLMIANVGGCSKSNDSEVFTKTSAVAEAPVDTSIVEEEIVAGNITADNLKAETVIENEEAEDEVKELPIPELLKNTDITDVLSLYNSNWDAYMVLSNDCNNTLSYNLWSNMNGTSHFDQTVIDKLRLEEDNYFRIQSERGSLSDILLGVNSNYYCISSYFTGLSWHNLSYESPCTVEECIQLFSNSGYSNIETEEIEALLTDNVVSGTIYSNNILWTVKVLLWHDTVQYIFFIPEGGIKNAPEAQGYDITNLLCLDYGVKGNMNLYVTPILDEYTITREKKGGLNFSKDKIACSETFTMYANSDLVFKACYVGKDKHTIGYAQDSDGLVCGYDILDDEIAMCDIRLGEKVESDHIVRIADAGDYYTVKQLEGNIDYIIHYSLVLQKSDWYLCIRLDSTNTVKGISYLRSDVCILEN